jgi:glycosyltransferase involved in cell wall biosynthesis
MTGDRSLAIELVVPTLVVGGMEVLVASMARGLAARGHRVGVTCLEYDGELAGGLRADGIRVSVVPTPGLRPLVHAPALAAHFAQLRLDVVHSHSGVWEKTARAARHAGVGRVVHTVHGLLQKEPWHGPLLKRWGARHTDWIVAVSEPLRDYLVREIGLRDQRVRVLINGIDTDSFRPGERTGALRERLGLDAATPLVGTVARLAPVKNHVMLVDAFARVVQRRPDAHLAIVGDGPMRAPLEERIAALGLTDRVHLSGMMTDLAPVYRDFDVFVLSSLAEGTSVSMLEAMASARGIVATRVGGNTNLLDDGACGVLVPSDDAEAMAGALDALLGAPAERARLGATARERVLAHFSEAAMLDAYEALYAPGTRGHETLTPEQIACVG